MPIYEFICDKCGNEFEELVGKDATPSCPKCGANQTRKLMSVCTRGGKSGNGDSYVPSSGGGCAGCSGGNCASCGH